MRGLDEIGPETDQDLLRRFAAGKSPEAFRALVVRHGPMIYQSCQRLLGSPHEAEDAAQAVFIVLFQRPPAVESLAGWLHAVARKTCWKMIRGRTRQARREQAVAAMRSQSADVPDDLGDVGELLDAALGTLPAAEREVVILRYLEGEGVEQVARRLGCSISTVSTRASQALGRLAQYCRQRGLAVAAPALALYLTQQGVAAGAAAGTIAEALAPVAAGPVAWQLPALQAANAVLRSMFWTRVAAWSGAGLAALVAVGVVAAIATSPPPPDEPLTLTATVLVGHPARVVQMAFSADGALLASIDAQQRLLVWNAATGNPARSLTVARSEREGGRPSAALALAPDGRTIAETVNKWSADVDFIDVASGTQRASAFGDGVSPARLAVFSPDGRYLATGPRLMLWEVGSGRRLWTASSEHARAIAFAPDAATLVVAGQAGGLELLATPTGAVLRTLPTPGPVQAMAAGPNGSVLVWTSDQLAQYDVAVGRLLAQRARVGAAPALVGCAAEGFTLVTGGQVVRQPWPLASAPAAVAALPARAGVTALAANGRRLAVAMPDHSIRLYDLAAGH